MYSRYGDDLKSRHSQRRALAKLNSGVEYLRQFMKKHRKRERDARAKTHRSEKLSVRALVVRELCEYQIDQYWARMARDFDNEYHPCDFYLDEAWGE